MPVEYEYEVVVTGDNITGRLTQLNPREENPLYQEEIVHDDERRLRLDTIEVLRSWLNRWTALTRSEYEHLTVLNTFTVLGRHLYAIVFPGNIGRGLREARDRATKTRSTLRLLLSFQAAAEDLAQLPWELLHADEEFLASEHRLVLSRSMSRGRRALHPPEPPLVVQFLVTIPASDDYKDQREQLIESLPRSTRPTVYADYAESTDYSSLITYNLLEDWNTEKATKLLATKPYPQVVHIIGVCRRLHDQTQDTMQIYLDDGAGPQWRNAQVLVNLFSGNEELSEEEQVRLVVLHLCEPSPLDFEVTFERLAPALIRRGIPAVLAMQYPLSGQAAGRFVKKLYESLARARSIEEAVQRARSDLFVQYDEDRLFGSPVLYMQTVDSQLLKLPTGSPAGADAGPSSVSAAKPPPSSMLDWLLDRLDELKEEPADKRAEAARIMRAAGDWPPGLSDAERLLTRQVREYSYRRDLTNVFSGLVKVVRNQMSGRDD